MKTLATVFLMATTVAQIASAQQETGDFVTLKDALARGYELKAVMLGAAR
jgi:hypothetical protein